jgi:hypothetical protein
MTTTPQRHAATHSLPISNGYSGGWSAEGGWRYSVYCGRCQDTFAPDLEWAERYFAARRHSADRSLATGYLTGGQHLDMTDDLAAEEKKIRKWLDA